MLKSVNHWTHRSIGHQHMLKIRQWRSKGWATGATAPVRKQRGASPEIMYYSTRTLKSSCLRLPLFFILQIFRRATDATEITPRELIFYLLKQVWVYILFISKKIFFLNIKTPISKFLLWFYVKYRNNFLLKCI